MSSERYWSWFRASRATGLVLALSVVASGCTSTGVYHVVEPGQTLYRIAKTYDIDAARLAKINGITDPTRLEPGQRLYIPDTMHTRYVPVTAPSKKTAPLAVTPAIKDKPAPKASARSRPSATKSNAPMSGISVTPPSPGTFIWPVHGKVVSEFGTESGKASKGVEIAVPHGTSVVAAAAGKVIFSNDMRGYGKLIILEHADNFFTVYGFNAKNLVSVNSFVGQGDRIALSGGPSNGKSPRLHFEIRKGKTAVNPIFFLP